VAEETDVGGRLYHKGLCVVQLQSIKSRT